MEFRKAINLVEKVGGIKPQVLRLSNLADLLLALVLLQGGQATTLRMLESWCKQIKKSQDTLLNKRKKLQNIAQNVGGEDLSTLVQVLVSVFESALSTWEVFQGQPPSPV
ncbi:MAG: hypothetical protein A2508_05280 [Candidatus Lambdaproteobacteria bacterium RIFOXYD12_FULL_49_8]|nr:MAG: hypothetical protein A2508_05280 [Candidatus Lambdaproteobacteria bacterium RIFOXYD12_FULL_49_8]